VLVVAGSLAALALSNRLRILPALQDWLATATGAVVLGVLDVVTVGAIVYWGATPERRAYPWAVLTSGGASTAMLVCANAVGWLGGTAFRPAIGVQCAVYGLAMTGMVALWLLVFRALGRRSTRLAFGVYLGWVVVFSAASIPVLQLFSATGVYVMQKGYTIFWDVLWGIVLHLVALGIHVGLGMRADER
jgi:hypothetical protein